MQLTPRYGADPVIVLDGDPAEILRPAVRQRRRLAETLQRFDAHQWMHASRCAGWSCRDVVVHLDSTNRFWAFSIAAGVRGEPTQVLRTFDPVASPAELVATTDLSAGEVLGRFLASNNAVITALEQLSDEGWTALAEAPPGHISVSALVHHALWDSWVHERDILLPLGLTPEVEADEVTACLRYGAALGPALARTRGDARTGSLALHASSPEVAAVVTIGANVAVRSGHEPSADLTLVDDAVSLVEAFSVRRPFSPVIAARHAWMLHGLVETFDGA